MHENKGKKWIKIVFNSAQNRVHSKPPENNWEQTSSLGTNWQKKSFWSGRKLY